MHVSRGLPPCSRLKDLRLQSNPSFLGTNIYGRRDWREPLLPRPIPTFHVRHFDCHRHRSHHSDSPNPSGLGNAGTLAAESQNDHLAGGRWCCDRGDSGQGIPQLPVHVFEKYVSRCIVCIILFLQLLLRVFIGCKLTNSPDVSADFALIIVTTMLELSTGFACVCLPSAKFLLDRATSSLDHSDQNWFGRERTAAPDRKPGSTVSTYWESIRTKMTTATTRQGNTTADGLQSSRGSKLWRRGRDIELGLNSEPVVFQQRLEVPSLRSTSDARSCTSRGGDHRGLSETEFAHCMEETASQKGQGDDLTDNRKDSIINLEAER